MIYKKIMLIGLKEKNFINYMYYKKNERINSDNWKLKIKVKISVKYLIITKIIVDLN